MQHSSILLLGLILASPATAQIGMGRLNDSNLPGDMVLPTGALNITASIIANFGDEGSGMDSMRGIVRLPNGHYLVSLGPGGGTNPKRYFEFDENGVFHGQTLQPFTAGGSGIGITDLAWDRQSGPGSRIWGGRAKGMMSYDWQAETFDPVIFPGSPNGLHLLADWQGADIRASAIGIIDGTQVLISADNNRGPLGAPDLAGVNYHIMGLPFATFPIWQTWTPSFTGILGAFDAGKNGAAFDPVRGTVWWQMDDRDNNLNPNRSGTRFIEMNMDGTLTGQIIQGAREIGGRALGCDMYIDAQGNRVLAYLVDSGSGTDNPLGVPGGDDVLIEMYAGFEFGSSCGGEISFMGEPFIGNQDWTITLSNAPANPSSAVFMFRGRAATPPGVLVPGLINCGLLLSLANPLISEGTRPLVGGEASFVRTLPNNSSLIGAEAAFQWLQPTTASVLPLNMSDAGLLRVGTNL